MYAMRPRALRYHDQVADFRGHFPPFDIGPVVLSCAGGSVPYLWSFFAEFLQAANDLVDQSFLVLCPFCKP